MQFRPSRIFHIQYPSIRCHWNVFIHLDHCFAKMLFDQVMSMNRCSYFPSCEIKELLFGEKKTPDTPRSSLAFSFCSTKKSAYAGDTTPAACRVLQVLPAGRLSTVKDDVPGVMEIAVAGIKLQHECWKKPHVLQYKGMFSHLVCQTMTKWHQYKIDMWHTYVPFFCCARLQGFESRAVDINTMGAFSNEDVRPPGTAAMFALNVS